MKTKRQRWDPETSLQGLLPTQLRLSAQIYDNTERPTYRAIYGLKAIVTVHSLEELETLWSAIEALLADPGWRTAPEGGTDNGRDDAEAEEVRLRDEELRHAEVVASALPPAD